MNQSKHPTAVNNSPKQHMAVNMSASEIIEGMFSVWPKSEPVESKQEVPTSTAAKGDDDVMSTPAKKTRP
ncbi:hypothetical protein [Stenotrophobium rhamnosiphilum]|uniref:Uncharacterized protein n=1 Tax=Stenotrophobium rhamnosiphilum TaxID=2029166 RepID=A0A2T5MI97_9GAMM|nr:hypothetical protein [Stenotrophobium rhamnosiphilum]PTU32301.1 hypothetical protein CJD38_06515 [Stenotrophobium rhamnosiphilum]